MITDAERDEIRTQAENYIHEIRLEFKIAQLGARINGTTRETGADDTRADREVGMAQEATAATIDVRLGGEGSGITS